MWRAFWTLVYVIFTVFQFFFEASLDVTRLIYNKRDEPNDFFDNEKDYRSKNSSHRDFWDELSLEQKAEIDKASLEIKNGEVSDYDLFIKKHL